jgi:hypothetical protein
MKDHLLLKLMISIGLIIPNLLTAQSITAPFDPTEPVHLPAAAGWREDKVAGATYREASGNRKIDGDEQYKFDSSGVSANLHFKMGNMSVDSGWEQNSTQATADQLTEGWINLDYDIGRFNIALSGNDFVTVGLGAKTNRSHDYFDATHDSETTTQTSIIGSLSVKTFDFLYLGGGYERVKEESTFRVDNTWNALTLGASVIFGDKGTTRLRLEYAVANSARTESDAQGQEDTAIHFKTDTSNYAAELMFSGLLFSARGTEQKIFMDQSENSLQSVPDILTISKNEAGVLWVPPNGVVLGFYFATYRTSYFFDDVQTEFRINFGYVFE